MAFYGQSGKITGYIKDSDQSIVNEATTYETVDGLTFPVQPNTKYFVLYNFIGTRASDSGAINIMFSVPSGATMQYDSGAASGDAAVKGAGDMLYWGFSVADPTRMYAVAAYIENGSNTGVVSVTFKQHSADAVTTTICAGSTALVIRQ